VNSEKFEDTKLTSVSWNAGEARIPNNESASDCFAVDKALDAGDMEFHKKCVQRFHGFNPDNRVFVFVSHNLDTVKSFCQKASIY
jgi:ABC-type polysaccharide/polyol phosphate transport system ATPase subunit